MKSIYVMCVLCVSSLMYLWATTEKEPTDYPVVKNANNRISAPQSIEKGCAVGCAAIPDETPNFTQQDFIKHLKKFATQPLDKASIDLETLLFYGKYTKQWLPQTSMLDAEHALFLQRELQKTHVKIELRVTDERGQVRIELPPTLVEIGTKYHQHVSQTHDMQPLEMSGTIKRVGVHHLWSRF